MSTLEIGLRFLSGVVLILMNAMFVLTEFGLTRLRQYDKEELMDDPRLKRGWEMTEELEIYLTGCQLGISATSVILGVVFEPAVSVVIRPLIEIFNFSDSIVSTVSVVVSIIIINLVHKVWGEQAPTYFGVEEPLKAVKIGSGFLYWWSKIMYPLIIFGDGLAKWTLRLFGIEMTRSWVEAEQEDNKESGDKEKEEGARTSVRSTMVELLKNKSDLSEDRAAEVVKSYDIGNKPVSDIMIAINDASILYNSKSISDSINTVRKKMYSRYPLYDDGNEYCGNIYLPSILVNYEALKEGTQSLMDLVKGKMIKPHDMPISQLIDVFQEESQELCMIEKNDEIVGLITLTDAIESVFGNLKDPFD